MTPNQNQPETSAYEQWRTTLSGMPQPAAPQVPATPKPPADILKMGVSTNPFEEAFKMTMTGSSTKPPKISSNPLVANTPKTNTSTNWAPQLQDMYTNLLSQAVETANRRAQGFSAPAPRPTQVMPQPEAPKPIETPMTLMPDGSRSPAYVRNGMTIALPDGVDMNDRASVDAAMQEANDLQDLFDQISAEEEII